MIPQTSATASQGKDKPEVDSPVEIGHTGEIAAEDEILHLSGVGRGSGQESGGVGSQGEETGNAGVEEAGEAPLDVESQGEDAVDSHHDEEPDEVVENAS